MNCVKAACPDAASGEGLYCDRHRAALEGAVVGRNPPRYAWWRHVIAWLFVIGVCGVGAWGLWRGLLWIVARLGAAWRGGG